MNNAQMCPVCRDDVCVPPVTLVPCGHCLCGRCVQQLRKTTGTILLPLRAGFRCPVCRVRAATYVVSAAEREAIPLTTDDQRTQDATFMQEYTAAMPKADGPSLQEMYAAHASSDDNNSSSSEEMDLHLTMSGRFSVPNAIGEVVATGFTYTGAGSQWSFQPVGSVVQTRSGVQRQADLLERRIPADLRMWDATVGDMFGVRDDTESEASNDGAYVYRLYVHGGGSRAVADALAQRLEPRGVQVEALAAGFFLTLPNSKRQQFLSQ